jgi:hypothetical protein
VEAGMRGLPERKGRRSLFLARLAGGRQNIPVGAAAADQGFETAFSPGWAGR